MRFFLFVYILLIANVSFSQEAQKDTISVSLDTLPLIPLEPKSTDTILRITNLNPFKGKASGNKVQASGHANQEWYSIDKHYIHY